jgi:hypothetical protein
MFLGGRTESNCENRSAIREVKGKAAVALHRSKLQLADAFRLSSQLTNSEVVVPSEDFCIQLLQCLTPQYSMSVIVFLLSLKIYNLKFSSVDQVLNSSGLSLFVQLGVCSSGTVRWSKACHVQCFKPLGGLSLQRKSSVLP